MDALRVPAASASPAAALLVMLPAAYSRPGDFVAEGLVGAARAAGVDAEIVLADAHMGYFSDRTVVARLREDIVLPARARGVRQVWLAGISLGGFAALGYAVRHPQEVDGVVVLAPYLGRRALLREIAGVGSVDVWAATSALREGDDEDEELERDIWRWLSRREREPAVWLGYGRDDRFAAAHRLLAATLPAQRVAEADGGHDWVAWRALWAGWLAHGVLPRRAARLN